MRSRDDLPELSWSPWVPLEGARRDARLPRLAGLYRIRSVETGRMLDIEQTGRSLKERTAALKGVCGEEMHYNDPYTARQALWAHRIEFGETAPRTTKQELAGFAWTIAQVISRFPRRPRLALGYALIASPILLDVRKSVAATLRRCHH